MSEGHLMALGPCLLCHDLFAFDPLLVCSVAWPPPNGAQHPVCHPCIVERLNPVRARLGLPPAEVLPGAYPGVA